MNDDTCREWADTRNEIVRGWGGENGRGGGASNRQ